ncbi:MAG: prepilin-type N-terminal cleavage/methylation domain-containing protein [Wujia sp.]
MLLHRLRDRRKSKVINNKGFSLVEMIIVIAIIAVLTGVATVTVTLINSAKAKDASISFNSELSDLSTKAQSQVCTKDDGTTEPTYLYCLMVYQKNNGKYYLKRGYYDTAAAPGTDPYVFFDSENNNGGDGIGLSSRVEIRYTDTEGVEKKIASSGSDTLQQVYIVFNRDGRILEGAGTFGFYKKNGNNVADVAVRRNGSHEVY